MKKHRKIGIAMLLSVVMLFSVILSNVAKADDRTKGDLLILGDSIATGYGLSDYNSTATPKATESWATLLSEKYEAKQYNYAVDGATVSDLLYKVKQSDSQIAIGAADVICISIGGNDFLNLLEESAQDMTTISTIDAKAQALLVELSEGLEEVFLKLREQNPTAVIMVQTLFHPFGGWTADAECIGHEGTIGEWMGTYVDAYNEILKEKTKTHGFLCIDVAKKFEEIGTEELVDTKVYDTLDAILADMDHIAPHPTEAGHAVIYDTYVETAGEELGEALMGYMNLAKYRSGDTYTYPTKSGLAFAGWYKDADFTTPLSPGEKIGYAYAKFVDEKVFSLKFQMTANTTPTSASTNLRILTSVDTLNYSKVGFQITINGKTLLCNSDTVYEKISAYVDNRGFEIEPTVFSKESSYFMTHRIANIGNGAFSMPITIKPCWTTLDGTVVEGPESNTRTITIQEFFTDKPEAEENTETIFSFDSYKEILHTEISLYNDFGATRMNQEQNYITEGNASWYVRPQGDYGVEGYYPFFRMKCYKEAFKTNDFTNYDKVLMDVYNASDEDVTIEWKFRTRMQGVNEALTFEREKDMSRVSAGTASLAANGMHGSTISREVHGGSTRLAVRSVQTNGYATVILDLGKICPVGTTITFYYKSDCNSSPGMLVWGYNEGTKISDAAQFDEYVENRYIYATRTITLLQPCDSLAIFGTTRETGDVLYYDNFKVTAPEETEATEVNIDGKLHKFTLQPKAWTTCEYNLMDADYSVRHDFSNVQYMDVQILSKKESKEDTPAELYFDNLRGHLTEEERPTLTLNSDFEQGLSMETPSDSGYFWNSNSYRENTNVLSRVAYADTDIVAFPFMGEYGLSGRARESQWPKTRVEFDKSYAAGKYLNFMLYIEVAEDLPERLGLTGYDIQCAAHTVVNGHGTFNKWTQICIQLKGDSTSLEFFPQLLIGGEDATLYMDCFVVSDQKIDFRDELTYDFTKGIDFESEEDTYAIMGAREVMRPERFASGWTQNIIELSRVKFDGSYAIKGTTKNQYPALYAELGKEYEVGTCLKFRIYVKSEVSESLSIPLTFRGYAGDTNEPTTYSTSIQLNQWNEVNIKFKTPHDRFDFFLELAGKSVIADGRSVDIYYDDFRMEEYITMDNEEWNADTEDSTEFESWLNG